MKLTLSHDEMNACCRELHDSNTAFKSHYPADSSERQPVLPTGITRDELRSRSVGRIVNNRTAK